MKIAHISPVLALFASAVCAQSTVQIGPDAIGCGPNGALLTDGNVARASVRFDYDAATALLNVTVENDSPSNPGRPSPVITRIYFNAPSRAIDAAVLLNQVGGGGQPGFALTFDSDAGDAENSNRADCFGFFNFRLASSGFIDGIANKDADTVCTESKDQWVYGPVTFTIQLRGPDVRGLNSEAFAASTSKNPVNRPVNVAVKFDGSNCYGFGTFGNGGDCRTAVFVRGTPALGNNIAVCVIGNNGCLADLLVSLFPGPTVFPDFTAPIGLPLVTSFMFGSFSDTTTEYDLPLTIPFAPKLLGMTLWFDNLEKMTWPVLRFSPNCPMTIEGELPQ